MSDWATMPAPGEYRIPAPEPEPLRADPADTGCWVDGVKGIYAPVAVVDIARSRGFAWPHPDTDADLYEWARAGQHGPGPMNEDSSVAWGELCDDAEQWLDDHIAPEGYWFGWLDGDFMLGSEAQWCEWMGDRCYEPEHDHGARPY
jgi:hypothetical protein